MPQLQALLIGKVGALGARLSKSAIAKRPIFQRTWLGAEGLTGDEQGDRKHHGGRDKALHHYPMDHYPAWRVELGQSDLLSCGGAFGENISTHGITEAEIAVGDIFRVGNALIEVSQGRQPCWKLNARFEVPDMAARVQASGRTGWYYRVVEPGFVQEGDGFEIIDRRAPARTIERLWRALYVNSLDREELAGIADLPFLADRWRSLAGRHWKPVRSNFGRLVSMGASITASSEGSNDTIGA